MSSNGSAKHDNGATIAVDSPPWLNETFFEDIVPYSVSDIKVAMATAKGENYASVMYRVNVNGAPKKDNSNGAVTNGAEAATANADVFIVKVLPDHGLHEEIIKEFNVFPKEIEMYATIVPEFERLMGIEFGPKCLKAAEKRPTDFIVLEDLHRRQFRMANRKTGLDLAHMEVALKKLAQFHAASVVHHQSHGPFSQRFDTGMFAERMRTTFQQFYDNFQDLFLDCVQQWPNGMKYFSIMDKIRETMFDRCANVSKPTDQFLNVLNHGDMWTNNMMFSYGENGSVNDVLLIDYQMCFWSSPAIDLNYFIITSAAPDIKISKFEYFIKFYYDHLSEALARLNYSEPLPSLMDLQLEVLRKGFYGYSASLGVFAITQMDSCEEAEMETFMKNDEKSNAFKRSVYTNPSYVAQMVKLLPFFDQRGIMDPNYVNP